MTDTTGQDVPTRARGHPLDLVPWRGEAEAPTASGGDLFLLIGLQDGRPCQGRGKGNGDAIIAHGLDLQITIPRKAHGMAVPQTLSKDHRAEERKNTDVEGAGVTNVVKRRSVKRKSERKRLLSRLSCRNLYNTETPEKERKSSCVAFKLGEIRYHLRN